MGAALNTQIPNMQETALTTVLRKFADIADWDQLRVAVAYASVAGLMHMLDVLGARSRHGYTSQWLIGLDDYLTQPGVLRTCLSLPNAELRTARLLNQGRRFHPKFYLVSQQRTQALACVGSSNLTLGGMSGNCEAFVSIQASTSADIRPLFREWDRLWQLGQGITHAEIDQYESEYGKLSPKWADTDGVSSMPSPGDTTKKRVLTSDSPSIDPSLAQICWIEVGKNTAMGRELEFKAEQALFFGLSPSGGPAQQRNFIISSGAKVPLRLKYQENAMWRLQMNNDVPEVATGLRPRDSRTGRLARSPYVAVFTRTDQRDTFFLKFVRDNSREYDKLRRQSAKTGAIGSTSARQYGWC